MSSVRKYRNKWRADIRRRGQAPMSNVFQGSILAALMAIFLVGCDEFQTTVDLPQRDPLIGTWVDHNYPDQHLVIREDGTMDVLFNGKSKLKQRGATARWDAVTEVEPHQLYVVMSAGEKTQRVPLFIYKFHDGKLVTRSVTTYHRTISGIQLPGVSRYEWPTDFSGMVDVHHRVRGTN